MVFRQIWYFGLPSGIKLVCSLWLNSQNNKVGKQLKIWFNSLIILVALEIWNQGNDSVFNGTNPDVAAVVHVVTDQGMFWCAAGAKDLQGLVAR